MNKSEIYVKNSIANLNDYAKGKGFRIVFRNKKTNAGPYTVKAKLTAGYLWSNYTADNVTFSCSIAKANLSNSTITSISDKTYTGSAIKPNPVVKMTLNGSSVTLTILVL